MFGFYCRFPITIRGASEKTCLNGMDGKVKRLPKEIESKSEILSLLSIRRPPQLATVPRNSAAEDIPLYATSNM